MKCRYCQSELHPALENDSWPICDEHNGMTLYFHVSSNQMEWLIGEDHQPHAKWLVWYDDCFRLFDDDGADNKAIMELDYLPQITPEEAYEFVDRLMKMKAFS